MSKLGSALVSGGICLVFGSLLVLSRLMVFMRLAFACVSLVVVLIMSNGICLLIMFGTICVVLWYGMCMMNMFVRAFRISMFRWCIVLMFDVVYE